MIYPVFHHVVKYSTTPSEGMLNNITLEHSNDPVSRHILPRYRINVIIASPHNLLFGDCTRISTGGVTRIGHVLEKREYAQQSTLHRCIDFSRCALWWESKRPMNINNGGITLCNLGLYCCEASSFSSRSQKTKIKNIGEKILSQSTTRPNSHPPRNQATSHKVFSSS